MYTTLNVQSHMYTTLNVQSHMYTTLNLRLFYILKTMDLETEFFELAKREKYECIIVSVLKDHVSAIHPHSIFFSCGSFTFINSNIVHSVDTDTNDDHVYLKNPDGKRFVRFSKDKALSLSKLTCDNDHVLMAITIKPKIEGLKFVSYNPENMLRNLKFATFSIDGHEFSLQMNSIG